MATPADLLRKLKHFLRYPALRAEENAMLLAGLHLPRIHGAGSIERLRDAELRVFSQWGEDGIIQWLIRRIPIENDVFIEFGVEDYRESNTRFLLRNDNWRGLVIDGNPAHVRSIREERISVYHDLQSVCAFVTRENINDIIAGAGLRGDIGLLSIDIDGNDYWVWEAIDVVSPRIVVCEYNAIFGGRIAVSVPYDPAFRKERAHHSRLFFGASLGALCHLAERKGYVFAGCTSAGNDAFFVRKEFASLVPATTLADGFVPTRARDSRGIRGEKTFLAGDDRFRAIGHLHAVEVTTGRTASLSELAG